MINNPLSIYGKPVKEYNGEGVLLLTNGTEISCSFIAGQLSDGDIRLFCDTISISGLAPTYKDLDYCSFFGTTDEGHRIWSKDNIIYLPNNHCSYAFSLNELIVEPGNLESAHEAIFYIDNFEFYGKTDHNRCLTLSLPELNKVNIVRVKEYDTVIRDIRISRGIDITCKMILEIPSEIILTKLECESVELCLLMSFSRGTRVQWIYYEIVNGIGDVIYRAHYDATTRPYQSLSAVIRTTVHGIDDTRKFLEQTYSTLCSNNTLRAISLRLINSYVDAKEHGYMESHGIKNAVVLEIIKSYALSTPSFDIPNYIISEDQFTKLKKSLKETIKENCPGDKTLQNLLFQNACGINRSTLRQIFSKIFEKIELPFEKNDLALLIESRNHLVHQGKFYTDSASESARRKLPPLESDFAELLFIQNSLDKIMLRLFGYHGNYISCRDPKNFEKNDIT